MVVYEIERFIRKTKAHYRLGGAHLALSELYIFDVLLVH